MRPEAVDIAAPEFPPRVRWLGEPPKMAELTATGPVLVHFFDFAQLNSIRALPYVLAWNQRYAEHGLATVGVQAPRFPFTAEADAVATACERLGVAHPVAVDSDFEIWADYGCEGWPSLFLWGQGGALGWFHFGEGEYAATERAIQDELRAVAPLAQLPETLVPLRPSDAEGGTVLSPTGEIFPGGSVSTPWQASADGDELLIEYEAGGAYATVDGEGTIAVVLDDQPHEPIVVQAAGLYELALHERHEAHSLALRPAPAQRIYSVSFAAGVP
jgi:hypothetical protein